VWFVDPQGAAAVGGLVAAYFIYTLKLKVQVREKEKKCKKMKLARVEPGCDLRTIHSVVVFSRVLPQVAV
jgi:hypothetical protein